MTALLGRAVRAGVAFATALVAVTAARSASAYCRTTTTPIPASYSPTKGCFTEGLPLFWKGQCVGYSVNSAASDLVDFDTATKIIDESFTTWDNVVCPDSGAAVGITASNYGPVDCSLVEYNQNAPNQNAIIFRDTEWPYSDPNNTLGLTTVTFNSDTGEIYDADMEINATMKNLTTTDVVPPNGFDLLSVITHEAGHFLGLAHATSSTSTMYASYKPGTDSLRTLSADDIAGVCSIYPTTGTRNVDTSVDSSGVTSSTSCDATPRHGFSTECGSTVGASSSDDATSTTTKGCAVSGVPGESSSERSPWSALAATGAAVLALGALRRKRAAPMDGA